MKKKKFKGIFALLLTLVMIFSSSLAAFAEESEEPVDKTIKPEIALSSGQYFDADVGKKMEYDIEFRNFSGYTANSLLIQPTIDDASNTHFKIYFEDGENLMTAFGGRGRKTLKMFVEVDKDAEDKTYAATLNYTYYNAYNVKFTGSDKIYFKVTGAEEKNKAALKVMNLVEPSKTFEVGQNFDVSFTLANQSPANAKNVKITASCLEGTMVVPKSLSVISMAELLKGQTKDVSFTFAATPESKSRNYTVQFDIEYEDGSKKDGVNNVLTFKQYAGVNIFNPKADEEEDEDENTSTPKIIVSDYQCDPLIVQAGQEFDLSMIFKNTHSYKAVSNIKMFLTLAEETATDTAKTGNIFTPVDSSNTFYFDSIAPKGTQSKKMRLYVVPDAQPKTYTLTVNFEYEDAKGKEYKATELLGINVKQATKLDVGDIFIPESIQAGMPVSVSFDFYNTGKVQVSNLMIRLEGDKIETQNKSTFFGNIDSGNSDYFEGSFYINEEGPADVKIIVAYDDPSGEHIEKVNEFSTQVMPMMEEAFNPDMEKYPEGDMGGGNSMKKIGIIAGAVVGAIIVLVIVFMILKKHKAKKEAAFLEAEEMEEEETEEVTLVEEKQEAETAENKNDNE